jgi:hypothetical protein
MPIIDRLKIGVKCVLTISSKSTCGLKSSMQNSMHSLTVRPTAVGRQALMRCSAAIYPTAHCRGVRSSVLGQLGSCQQKLMSCQGQRLPVVYAAASGM